MTEYTDEDIWGSPSPSFDTEDYIRKAATARGIDPETALRVAKSEGLNQYEGDRGTSFGPFQLHYGTGARHGMGQAGMGNEFTAQTGLDARDPATTQQQIDFALDHAKKNGWGAWYGARRAGIADNAGINQEPMRMAPADGSNWILPSANAATPAKQELSDEEVWGTVPESGAPPKPGEPGAPHAPMYDENNKPIDQSQLKGRPEPFAGMPLEQAWASDPISQGLDSVMQNSDVQTGLFTLGMHPELMAVPEIAAGANLLKNRPSVPKAAAPKQLTAEGVKNELKAQSQAAYKEASDAGVVIPAQSYNDMVHTLARKMSQEGLRPKIHGDTAKGLGELIKEMDRLKPRDPMANMTHVEPKAPSKTFDFETIDQLRRVLGAAGKGFDPQKADDRRLADIAVEHMDDWFRNLTTKDVQAGDPQKAVAAVKKARELWGRMRRAELLEEAHEKALNATGANYSAAQYQTAIKQQYRAILGNKGKLRHFTRAERAAMKGIVRGDKTERTLRYLGKYAPTSPMSLFLGGGLGYASVGGIPGAVVGAAIGGGGMAARAASTRMTKNKVNDLLGMVRGQ